MCVVQVLVLVPVQVNGLIPQGNRLDLVKLNLPLENLLDLAFIWSLFYLLSTNQVQEAEGQNEVPFHSLEQRQGVSLVESKSL